MPGLIVVVVVVVVLGVIVVVVGVTEHSSIVGAAGPTDIKQFWVVDSISLQSLTSKSYRK